MTATATGHLVRPVGPADARTLGAPEFWSTFGHIVHDARGPHDGFQTVHLEIPLKRGGERPP